MSDIDLTERLDYLSTLTGIKEAHLRLLRDGQAYPSEFHYRRLAATLDPDELDAFLSHEKVEPETIRTVFGRLPEGYRLIPRVALVDVRVGDLIPYKDPTSTRGNYWVEVQENDSEARRIIAGGVVVPITSEHTTVKVARQER